MNRHTLLHPTLYSTLSLSKQHVCKMNRVAMVKNAVVYIGTTTPLVVGSAATFASTTLTTNHVINLSGLLSHTQYYYVLESTDAAGNSTHTAQNSFSTTY